MPYNHLTFCHPLLLPPSIFAGIRVLNIYYVPGTVLGGRGYKGKKDVVSVLTEHLVTFHNNNPTRVNIKWSVWILKQNRILFKNRFKIFMINIVWGTVCYNIV